VDRKGEDKIGKPSSEVTAESDITTAKRNAAATE
jgi:hypothetical protein